jgi:hypothetical protein
MGIHPKFEASLRENPQLSDAVTALKNGSSGEELYKYVECLAQQEPLLRTDPAASVSKAQYKPVFVKTIYPKIIPAIKKAIETGSIPEIEITFKELDLTRQQLKMSSFGSPQDVLYTFTSDRAPDWGLLLTKTLFRSACMSGEAKILVTIAPRFLSLSKPNFETTELEGAISLDFWESNDIVSRGLNFNQSVSWLIAECGNSLEGLNLNIGSDWTKYHIEKFLSVAAQHRSGKVRSLASALRVDVGNHQEIHPGSDDYVRLWNRQLKKKLVSKGSQEQIALKYIEEGRFLQKLLGGITVDHLQSNVKMQKNPLRGNKVEVDSIYRATGRKQIILVEAKDNDKISTTQLYSLFETFRLRLPQDWTLTIVAALLSKPKSDQRHEVSQIIDLIELSFNEDVLGDIPESLFSVTARRHYRWNVTSRKDAPS